MSKPTLDALLLSWQWRAEEARAVARGYKRLRKLSLKCRWEGVADTWERAYKELLRTTQGEHELMFVSDPDDDLDVSAYCSCGWTDDYSTQVGAIQGYDAHVEFETGVERPYKPSTF